MPPSPGPSATSPRTLAAPRRAAVTAIVLSWNSRDEVLACLDDLDAARAPGDQVILVDNGSVDGTESAVREGFPWVDVVQNGANLGFAGGNNAGIERALGLGSRYVLLLNADARIDAACVDALVEHLERESDVAAVQPLLVRFDAPDVIDSAGQRLTPRGSPVDALSGASISAAGTAPRAIFGACAAAVLLRTAALRDVGAFDPGLFILFEDVDLMYRLRASGWDVHLLPSVRAVHRRGISRSGAWGADDVAAHRRRFWQWRNHTALALRYVPLHRLLFALPRSCCRVLGALWLSFRLPGERVMPLWCRFLRARRASRRALREHGVDRWFGAT